MIFCFVSRPPMKHIFTEIKEKPRKSRKTIQPSTEESKANSISRKGDDHRYFGLTRCDLHHPGEDELQGKWPHLTKKNALASRQRTCSHLAVNC